jgi:hypothetical protein
MMNFQQNAIDRIKGVVARPVPREWLDSRMFKINPEDGEIAIHEKQINANIAAETKPWFFIYRYSALNLELTKYLQAAQSNCKIRFGKTIDDLYATSYRTEDEEAFLFHYEKYMPVSRAPGTMNRICWAIEREFDGADIFKDVIFDYSVLKNGVDYDQKTFNLVKHICDSYKPGVLLAKKNAASQYDNEIEEDWQSVDIILQNLVEALYSNCPNEDELCNILVDLCYDGNTSKQILWKACGDVIINRLLKSHDYRMSYPQKTDSGEFWCQGIQYTMKEVVVKGGENSETV